MTTTEKKQNYTMGRAGSNSRHWEPKAPKNCCHREPEQKPQATKSVRLRKIIHPSRDSNGVNKNTLLDPPRVKTIQDNKKDKLYIGSSGKSSKTLKTTNYRVSKDIRIAQAS